MPVFQSKQYSNPAFTERDLSLIRGYAARYKPQYGSFGDKQVTHFPSFGFEQGFRNGLGWEAARGVSSFFSSDSSSNSPLKTDSSEKKYQTSYGFSFAIAVLATSFFYIISTIPRIYSTGKEYYYTRKITQLASRKSDDTNEMHIIKNLKELIKADKSGRFLRDQNIKIVSAMGISTATLSYLAGELGGFATGVQTFIKTYLPEKVHLSGTSAEKVIKILSDENMITFAKVATIASVGLFSVNVIRNLWSDFFDDVNNPKEFLQKKSHEIETTLNILEYGNVFGSYNNMAMRAQNLFS